VRKVDEVSELVPKLGLHGAFSRRYPPPPSPAPALSLPKRRPSPSPSPDTPRCELVPLPLKVLIASPDIVHPKSDMIERWFVHLRALVRVQGRHEVYLYLGYTVA